MKRPVLVFAAAVLLGAPAVAAERGTLQTRIATVLDDRARLDGRTVRLRGLLDQCDRYVCRLCPELASADEACLTIANWRIAGSRQDDRWEERHTAANQRYRFSDVLLEGRVDFLSNEEREETLNEQASASLAAAEQGLAIDYVYCTDPLNRGCVPWGQVVLRDVSVSRILRRRGPGLGRSSGLYARRLTPVAPDAALAMRDSLAAQAPKALKDVAFTAFYNPEFEAVGLEDGYFCHALTPGVVPAWPRTVGALNGTALDGYRCYAARRSKERWTVYLDSPLE